MAKKNRPKDAQSPDVLIIISGGSVQYVGKPKGITLEIRDYDIKNGDEPENRDDCYIDEDKDWYQKMFWGKDDTAYDNDN